MPKKTPSRPRKTAVVSNAPVPETIHDMTVAVRNGLAEAILGFSPGVLSGMTEQLSQTDTLFKNNRYYLISNERQLLSTIYVEHGLIQTLIDVPVDDGLRGGVEIKSKQLSEDQIQQLQDSLDREGDMLTIGQGHKWKRLFGGGGVLVITDQDPATPLDVDAIGPDSPLMFRDVDMWELYWTATDTENRSAQIKKGEPLMVNSEFYNYYGQRVHHTRVLKMVGLKPPSFIRPRLRGWGFSVVEPMVRSINQYLKSTDLIFEVLDEFKVDIFKIKNLATSLIQKDGMSKVRERIHLANRQKNFQNAVTMDSEDDWDHKELSFAGIAETMNGIRMQIASDMRMPLTKIFGISATGFNSGEDDIENYNSMVESQIRHPAKFDILRVCEIRCQKLFGFRPDDLSCEFKPLRVLSSEQQENVKNAKHARVMATRQAGEMSPLEFKDACNADDLLPIQLDTSEAALDEQEMERDEKAAEQAALEGENGDKAEKVDKSDSKIKAKDPKDAKESKETKT